MKRYLFVVMAGLFVAVAATTGASTATATPPGPFATFLFSRTEITAADGCQPNDVGIARLDTTVAPYLAARGMKGTGTLVTDRTLANANKCTHYDSSLMASWAQAHTLADTNGWSFVSHTATYPANMAGLTDAQAQAETCGSAQTIDAHGLPGGHGLIAYPGAQPLPVALQTDYSSKCFAWGRMNASGGRTWKSDATTSPYWQRTSAPNGGPCNDSTAACYNFSATGSKRYVLPSQIIPYVQSLKPGMWFTLQAYIEVTGTNPPYTSSPIRWDCTSPDSALHWTNDNERYCLSDWQQIVDAVAAVPAIQVTDPLSVGVAFGRPATY